MGVHQKYEGMYMLTSQKENKYQSQNSSYPKFECRQGFTSLSYE